MRPSYTGARWTFTWVVHLELSDIRAVRDELHPAHVAVGRGLPDGVHHRAGLLPMDPEEDRGAGTRDRGADCAKFLGVADELHRARVEVLAPRLVEPVLEPSADQVEVVALQAEHEKR